MSTLVVGRDITFEPAALNAPTPASPHILVVGGGVTGLVTSWLLLDRGYNVTIISSVWANASKRLTSQIAGALWEYPPAVCGHHRDKISLQHSKKWSLVSYGVFSAMAEDSKVSVEAGVKLRRSVFFFKGNVDEDAGQKEKMDQIASSKVIKGFRRDPELIRHEGVAENYGIVDAYEHLAPVIDTDQAMEWLRNLVSSKGARLVTETIKGDLVPQEQVLLGRWGAHAIVNATGLAAEEVAADKSCYPVRGGLIRVVNDGNAFPKLDTALIVPASATCGTDEIVFIVPRNENILLLGGTTEPRAGELTLSLNSPIIKKMRARCEAFMPGLKNARLDPEYPFAQGLRPFRGQNVRVERELRPAENGKVSMIVHSYGHGGAGWSLSFGCALDVVAFIEDALLGIEPRPMSMPATRASKL